jgi:hypothetical protein
MYLGPPTSINAVVGVGDLCLDLRGLVIGTRVSAERILFQVQTAANHGVWSATELQVRDGCTEHGIVIDSSKLDR